MLIGIAIVVVLSTLGNRFIGLPYGSGVGIVVLAMIVNGVIAEWEDGRPGGFFDPSGDDSNDRP
jgi:hypothetical protein